MKPPFPPFDEPNLCTNYILKDPEYIDRFCIDFPSHCVLNQVDSDTNLLDIVLLTKNDLQPTKKPRSVGPHKLKLEKTTSKKKSYLKNKKLRSVSIQLREGYSESSSGEENMLQQRLFYTNEDLKNSSFVTCILTKNRSHIVSSISIPGCSPHSGNNQRFKLHVESHSIPGKDIEFFYHLIEKLLFTNKIVRPDVQACVTYIFTRMKLPTNYH